MSIGGAKNLVHSGRHAQNVGMPNRRIIPQRVIQAREARGWKPAELARRAGISQPTLWALENGKTKDVKYDTIAKIASATGKHVAYFVDTRNGNTDEETPVPYGRVPLISWVRAGAASLVFDPYQPGFAEEWEDASVSVSRLTFALRVRGDSMIAPDGTGFPEGSIIIVDPEVEPKNGDFVVVRFDDSDEATFKRLVIDGPHRILRPLNPQFPTIPVTPDARICGVVVEMNIRKRFR